MCACLLGVTKNVIACVSPYVYVYVCVCLLHVMEKLIGVFVFAYVCVNMCACMCVSYVTRN